MTTPAILCYETAIGIACSVWYLYKFHRQRMPEITLADLGVAEGYNFIGLNQDSIDQYENIKAKLMEKFAGDVSPNDHEETWISGMSDIPKKMLLHVLLARTIRLMAPLEQVQKDRKGQHRLYQAKVLPEDSWSSFLASEQLIAEEYDACMTEYCKIEPGKNPHDLIRKAGYLWHTFGEDWKEAVKMSPGEQQKLQIRKMQEKLAAAGTRHSNGQFPKAATSSTAPKRQDTASSQSKPESPSAGQGSGKYSWRQDGDEVEICFQTPSTIGKKDINVHMTSSFLRVDIKGQRVLAGPLHGPIDPLGSTWTHSKKNGLEISLSKDRKNDTWASLFAAQG